MSYTPYLLEKDAPAISHIKSLEKTRRRQLKLRNAELKKYGAMGCVSSGLDGHILALKFHTGEQPKGWKVSSEMRKFSGHDDDLKHYGCYRLVGSSKEAKAIREHWSTLKMDGLKNFTRLFKDLPKSVSGWGFQKGLTIRQMGFEKLKGRYVLLVPDCDGENYVPEKSRELLKSEYKKMGGDI